MIVCRQCGKKKKVQRLPKHHATWECATCAKARAGHKVAIACFHCHKEVAIRPRKVEQSDYYLCGHCGFSGHRDVVGQVNILSAYLHGIPGKLPLPAVVKHRMPHNLRLMLRRWDTGQTATVCSLEHSHS